MGSQACDRVLRLCVTITLLAALAGCSGKSTNPEDNGQPDSPIHEPWEDEEAELLALLMSGELCAPRDLYERVQKDLAQIRSEWGERIPALKRLTITPMWYPMGILLNVDRATYDDIVAGRYTAWDSLNTRLEVDTIVPHPSEHGISLYVGVGFSANLNPRITFAAYSKLPGVLWVSSSFPGPDFPNVYGYVHDFGCAYLFRDAWGDCPAGCTGNHFWYFRSTTVGTEYVGQFNPGGIGGPGQDPATWWDEASMAVDLFYGEDHHWWWEK